LATQALQDGAGDGGLAGAGPAGEKQVRAAMHRKFRDGFLMRRQGRG
jgi:hypothetical protein